jgi:hypothetical protein
MCFDFFNLVLCFNLLYLALKNHYYVMSLKGNTIFHYILICFLFPNYLFGRQENFNKMMRRWKNNWHSDNTKHSDESLF